MKTESATAFPTDFITDTFISVESITLERSQASSGTLSGYLNGALAVILGAVVVFGGISAWMGYDLHKAIHGRMTYLECTKAVILHSVSSERGIEYQLSKDPLARGTKTNR
jgi:hypothetical protein